MREYKEMLEDFNREATSLISGIALDATNTLSSKENLKKQDLLFGCIEKGYDKIVCDAANAEELCKELNKNELFYYIDLDELFDIEKNSNKRSYIMQIKVSKLNESADFAYTYDNYFMLTNSINNIKKVVNFVAKKHFKTFEFAYKNQIFSKDDMPFIEISLAKDKQLILDEKRYSTAEEIKNCSSDIVSRLNKTKEL